MQSFDIVREHTPDSTFRVNSVIGTFDLQTNSIKERFVGNIDMPDEWSIGVIVGNSGTGKTTIAKELFPDSYITEYEYQASSILDDMPKDKSVTEITKAFNSVGFSSPPSWLKPYRVLSNGEKMRVDLARAILENNELFVFDEFTSVVDRDVAKVGSLAIQKAIRRTDKQFIAVGCHFDIIDWLMPDWVFDTNDMTFHNYEEQKKNRPKFNIKIFQTQRKSEYWKMFSRYHYLSHTFNKASRVYIMTLNDVVCGFCATLQFPHPTKKNFHREHRTVILPDFQGIGLSKIMTNNVAEILKNDGKGFISTTSNPSMIASRAKDDKWAMTRKNRASKGSKTGVMQNSNVKNSTSHSRITASFQYIG